MVNNDILLKLLGIIKLLIIVATFILSPVFIYSLISIVTNRDVLINSEKYKKVNVVVDSIIDINSEGSTDGEIYGFSKELDNYKTEIIFGTIMDDDYPEKLGLDSLKKRHVWFRKGKRWAYPANSEDKYFPIRGFIYKKIKTSLIFLILMCLTICFFKRTNKKHKE